MTPVVRKFTRNDAKNWDQLEDKQILGGNVIDRSYGYSMSSMYWQLGRGEEAPVPAPYDEVWTVMRGKVSIRSDQAAVTAGPGEILLVPKGTPGTAHIEADAELLTIAHPPSWEIAPEAWQAIQAGNQVGSGMERVSLNEVVSWEEVGDQAFIANIPDEAGFALGLGFARLAPGSALTLADYASHDVIIAVTKGAAEVSLSNSALTMRPGEFVYRPAGNAAVLHATDESEVALVRYPGSDLAA